MDGLELSLAVVSVDTVCVTIPYNGHNSNLQSTQVLCMANRITLIPIFLVVVGYTALKRVPLRRFLPLPPPPPPPIPNKPLEVSVDVRCHHSLSTLLQNPESTHGVGVGGTILVF